MACGPFRALALVFSGCRRHPIAIAEMMIEIPDSSGIA